MGNTPHVGAIARCGQIDTSRQKKRQLQRTNSATTNRCTRPLTVRSFLAPFQRRVNSVVGLQRAAVRSSKVAMRHVRGLDSRRYAQNRYGSALQLVSFRFICGCFHRRKSVAIQRTAARFVWVYSSTRSGCKLAAVASFVRSAVLFVCICSSRREGFIAYSHFEAQRCQLRGSNCKPTRHCNRRPAAPLRCASGRG